MEVRDNTPPICFKFFELNLQTNELDEGKRREIEDIQMYMQKSGEEAKKLLGGKKFNFARLDTTDEPGLIVIKQQPGNVFFVRCENGNISLDMGLTKRAPQ